MAILIETPTTRLYSPTEVFGGRFRHDCMAGCGNVLIVPDPETPGAPNDLREGQIWRCRRCGGLHEYYLAMLPGQRYACVRLLEGIQRRTAGEPLVREFVDK